jgi:hypothetical protein
MMSMQQRQQQQERKNDTEKRNRHDLFFENPRSSSTSRRRRDGSSSSSSSSNTKQEAQDIQKSLLRTRGLLQNELQRVYSINQTIEQDGQILEKTLGDHKSLATKQASKALKALKDAQRQEQRVFNASIVFFMTVVLYVMWSRVFIKLDFISPIINLFL